MRTVIALYEDQQISRSAMDDLVEHGFEKDRINVVFGGIDEERRPEAVEDELMRDLDSRNVPHDNVEAYVESVRRGCSLIVVETSDERADEASSILDRHTPVDLDEATRRPMSTESGTTGKHADVVQEDVKVGKRAVERGGIRVHSYVTERPVEEELTLREERPHAERHRVDERLSPEAAERAFKEETIEVRAHGEEPVVAKEARVVERVDVGKEATTRKERVQATERRRDVEIENLGEQFLRDEDDFRRDWEANYKDKGVDYETYRHAYALGHRSRGEERHRSSEWSTAEPELQREWESRHKDRGPWDKFRAAIRRGWDKARS